MSRISLISLIVCIMASAAAAQQWPTPVNISNTAEANTFSLNPTVSIDANGFSRVTYDDGLDSPTKAWTFWYTDNVPGSWVPRINIGYPVPDCRNSSHGYRPNGDLAVNFGAYPNGYGHGVAETYLVEQVNGVWQSPFMVSPNDSQFSYGGTAFAVDKDGGVHVGWLDSGNPSGMLWPSYRYRSPAGVWSPVSTVAQALNGNGRTSLCVTGSGSDLRVHFFYGDRTSGWSSNQVYYSRLSGTSWTPAVIVSNSPSYSGEPLAISDKEKRIYLFWNQEEPAGSGYINIFLSESDDAGSTWSVPVDVTPGVQTVANPEACLNGSGTLHLVYEQQISTTYDREIMHRTLTQTGWSPPQNISNMPGNNSAAPSIDCRGNVLAVVWQDNGSDSGNYDIYYTSAVLPPSTVRDLKAFAGSDSVTLNWTNSDDPSLAGVVIVYRTDRFPGSPTDGTVLVDRPAVKSSADNYQHTGVPSGTNCYYAVYSYDAGSPRPYSTGCCVSTLAQNAPCSSVKSLGDGTPASLAGKVVTAKFTNCWYIEDEDRTSAMRVQGTTDKIIGDRVNVSGTLGTYSQNGRPSERQITSPAVTFVSHGNPLEPMTMLGRSVGGAALNELTPGVINGIGPNNMGLLVRVFGRVISGGNPFYIDDGSGVSYRNGHQGLKITGGHYTAIAGEYLVVQGIVQGQIAAYTYPSNEPIVQMRSAADLLMKF